MTAEYDGGGSVLRRYVHGTGEDDPLLWYEGAGLGDRRSLQSDHQGSVVSIADASGNAVAVNAFDEYGKPSLGNLGRFQYTGQAWLPEVGLYHYKARMYAPALGRFMQTDPVGYDDQINLYAYVANDPVNKTDPTGTEQGSYGPNGEYYLPGDNPNPSFGKAMIAMTGFATMLAAPILASAPIVAATVDATFARVGASMASRATQGLELPKILQGPVQRAIDRAVNIGRDNSHVKDFLGAARESAGKPTGFNHVKEMQQSIRGLEKSSEAIGKAMSDTRVGQATREALGEVQNYADSLAQRMKDALK